MRKLRICQENHCLEEFSKRQEVKNGRPGETQSTMKVFAWGVHRMDPMHFERTLAPQVEIALRNILEQFIEQTV